MKNVPQILKALEKRGFRLDYTRASTAKIFPPGPKQPFYSAHVGSDRMIHPLKRFARKNWNLDLTAI